MFFCKGYEFVITASRHNPILARVCCNVKLVPYWNDYDLLSDDSFDDNIVTKGPAPMRTLRIRLDKHEQLTLLCAAIRQLISQFVNQPVAGTITISYFNHPDALHQPQGGRFDHLRCQTMTV